MDKLSGQTTLEIRTDNMEVSDPLPSSGSKIVVNAVSKPRLANQVVRDIALLSQSDSDEFGLSMNTDQDFVNLSLYKSLAQPVIISETPNKYFKTAQHQKKTKYGCEYTEIP
jgi:hypothetical protein